MLKMSLVSGIHIILNNFEVSCLSNLHLYGSTSLEKCSNFITRSTTHFMVILILFLEGKRQGYESDSDLDRTLKTLILNFPSGPTKCILNTFQAMGSVTTF